MIPIIHNPRKAEFIGDSGCSSLYWEPLIELVGHVISFNDENRRIISAAIQGFQHRNAAVYLHEEKPGITELIYGLYGIAIVIIAGEQRLIKGPLTQNRFSSANLKLNSDNADVWAIIDSKSHLITPVVIDPSIPHMARGTTTSCRYITLKLE